MLDGNPGEFGGRWLDGSLVWIVVDTCPIIVSVLGVSHNEDEVRLYIYYVGIMLRPYGKEVEYYGFQGIFGKGCWTEMRFNNFGRYA